MLITAVTEALQTTTNGTHTAGNVQDDKEPVVEVSGPCLVVIDDTKVWVS